ncbi:Kae1-associated serine/threonine protein kinase [Candidatus Micrarchaeota archaeon]|nr:Kae1-associated serine/threonine protein kinase [Candidatus Micrarchaeota archaeon]
MRGAEAVLSKTTFIGRAAVVKSRIVKGYRVKELDSRLRSERTRSEARLLHRAKLAGVDCPTVLCVDDFDITMTFVSGKRPEMTKKQSYDAGAILAKLHANDIIHGDYTPANLVVSENKKTKKSELETTKPEKTEPESCASGSAMPASGRGAGVGVLFVIDFGLGFVSNDIEDKAVDVFTMLRALDGNEKKDGFVEGYRAYVKSDSVLKRVKDVEKRVRYAF